MSNKREEILNTAVELARKEHFRKVSREAIAKRLNVSNTLISYYFKNKAELVNAIMEKAIKEEILEIICQGLAVQNKIAQQCPHRLKWKAAKSLLN